MMNLNHLSITIKMLNIAYKGIDYDIETHIMGKDKSSFRGIRDEKKGSVKFTCIITHLFRHTYKLRVVDKYKTQDFIITE